MIDIPVPIIVIDEDKRDRYLEKGYKPLLGDYDKKKFGEEFEIARETIKAAIEKHWKHWSLGECGFSMDKAVHEMDFESDITEEGDFFISEDYFNDRFLCIEVLQEELLTPLLLNVVHKTVLAIEPDYSVDICNAFPGLKTKDGELYPRFNIFVEKDKILIYSESKDVFEKLGISRSHKTGATGEK